MRSRIVRRSYLLGFSTLVLVFVLGLKYGAVSSIDPELVIQLRLPRVLLALSVGLGLSVAGVCLQALFSNPLCEPYTLGISSGAAVGAVIGSVFGLTWNWAGLMGTAFLGALAFGFALYLLSFRLGKSSVGLLLAGVMLGFLGSSLVAVWMALADPRGIQGTLFWLLGDVSRARMNGAVIVAISVFSTSALIWSGWRKLDALLMGEENAETLGVDIAKIQKRLLLLTSLLAGACVSAAGIVGFVGLVIPHFIRRVNGGLHFHLIPLSGIWGATVLIGADLISRSAFSPIELPVGVVTGIFGAPFFLYLMLQQNRKETDVFR